MRQSVAFTVLREIARRCAEHGGCAHPTLDQIATGAAVDRNTAKAHIPEFEAAGYVRVRHSTTKGVANEYEMTAKGMDALRVGEATFEASFKAELDKLAPEELRRTKALRGTEVPSNASKTSEATFGQPRTEEAPGLEPSASAPAPPELLTELRVPCLRCGQPIARVVESVGVDEFDAGMRDAVMVDGGFAYRRKPDGTPVRLHPFDGWFLPDRRFAMHYACAAEDGAYMRDSGDCVDCGDPLWDIEAHNVRYSREWHRWNRDAMAQAKRDGYAVSDFSARWSHFAGSNRPCPERAPSEAVPA
jgi:DNA-binding MarR family transcriptional regulator